MFSRRLLIAAAAATFVVALIALFPARVAIAWFAPGEFRATGVEGTVWEGSAAGASVSGVYLAPLSWRFRPSALLGGAMGYEVDARMPGGRFAGNVALTLTGAFEMEELEASVPLANISRLLPVAQAEGQLRAVIERGRFRDGWPTDLVGIVSIEELIYLPAGSNSIGNYRVEFLPTEDEGLRGVLADGGGPLEVAGELLVTGERDYELRGQVRARPGAPSALSGSLQFLGSADAAGMREFSLAGRL